MQPAKYGWSSVCVCGPVMLSTSSSRPPSLTVCIATITRCLPFILGVGNPPRDIALFCYRCCVSDTERARCCNYTDTAVLCSVAMLCCLSITPLTWKTCTRLWCDSCIVRSSWAGYASASVTVRFLAKFTGRSLDVTQFLAGCINCDPSWTNETKHWYWYWYLNANLSILCRCLFPHYVMQI